MSARPLTCIDLFCGCGGFSLGMDRAGFQTLAAIDFNPEAIATFKANLPDVPQVLEKNLTQFRPADLDALLPDRPRHGGKARVDVIVGGPPCQGFSMARRRDGANHGDKLKPDKRRELYQEFLAYVAYFQPNVFVMENVLGLKTAASGDYFARVQSEARALGYRVHGEVVRAWQFGVPQKRIRQLIIGTRRELPLFAGETLLTPTYATEGEDLFDVLPRVVTLWEAIGDLPPRVAGEGKDGDVYSQPRWQSHLARYKGRYLKQVLEIHKAKVLTGHVARPHSERDLRDFALLLEGESSAVAMRDRAVEFEWPYSKEHFKDRYTRQHRNRLCSTIVAHLAKDGLMFIHPTQRRSLTPREAARVQSFPDWFRFPEARTHSFRLIGNAVPPLIGQAVGRAVKRYLSDAFRIEKRTTVPLLPKDESQAVEWLHPLLEAAQRGDLPTIKSHAFKLGWVATGFLCYGLHPDAAAENGRRLGPPTADLSTLSNLQPEWTERVYLQSGWPVALVPIAAEAQRRLKQGLLSRDDYYCSAAHVSGARKFDVGRN